MFKTLITGATLFIALSATAAEPTYNQNVTLYGGFEIDVNGVLHSSAKFACLQPALIGVDLNVEPIKVFVKTDGRDCRMVPTVKPFTLDLAQALTEHNFNFNQINNSIVIGNKVTYSLAGN